jgi:hypothetical protein
MAKNTTRLPADNCPWCGYLIDAASPIDGKATPKPSDITLCLSCGSVLQFGADMRVGKITDAAVREGLSAKAYEGLMQARRVLLGMDRKGLSQRGRK